MKINEDVLECYGIDRSDVLRTIEYNDIYFIQLLCESYYCIIGNKSFETSNFEEMLEFIRINDFN